MKAVEFEVRSAASEVLELDVPDDLDLDAIPRGADVDFAIRFTPAADLGALTYTATAVVVVPIVLASGVLEGPFPAGRTSTVTVTVPMPEPVADTQLSFNLRSGAGADAVHQVLVSLRVRTRDPATA